MPVIVRRVSQPLQVAVAAFLRIRRVVVAAYLDQKCLVVGVNLN